jgi:phosphatidylglycerophosphatase C
MHIGLFDLDGTISRHDTLVPYLLGFCLRRPHRLLGLLKMPVPALRYIFGGRDRGRLKQDLIQAMLKGVTRSDIARWNERWVPRLLKGSLHKEALKRIEEHRENGDYLVLMSASPDLYVPAIARALRMNETICTGVRWDGMVLNGELTTPNRRGEEKLRCVQALRRRYPQSLIAAYGNSASDLEHMRACDRAFLVNASSRAVREAARFNVDIGWQWQRS